MRFFLLLILTVLLVFNANGQVSFSTVDCKLQKHKSNNLTELICSSSTTTITFHLKRSVTVLQQNNFASVDSQAIQIALLKFSGHQNSSNGQSMAKEKQLLDTYSKYELEYFKTELGIDVINPTSQWVVTKSKGWFIWYFKLGNIPAHADNPTVIQLFASTIVGDKILTVNAPILSDGDFKKAGLIVNDMMETLIIGEQ